LEFARKHSDYSFSLSSLSQSSFSLWQIEVSPTFVSREVGDGASFNGSKKCPSLYIFFFQDTELISFFALLEYIEQKNKEKGQCNLGNEVPDDPLLQGLIPLLIGHAQQVREAVVTIIHTEYSVTKISK
jgi:hypothetical protein